MDDNNFKTQFGEIEEIEDGVEKRFKRFKKFDIITDPPSDHRFIYKRFLFDPRTNSQTIKKEREILEANLPNYSIFVRVYESRIDLMRAAIIGLEGTPYGHGLFFFDIFFPSNYPTRPPEVLYHSHGLHLSPNLHKNGKVSVNLLNHWYQFYGRKEHKWNPKQSTILELLILIQNQVLNAKPFLNEHVPRRIYSEEQCLKYNKHVFMLTCEAMLYVLKMPPENFEDLVFGHFRHRAHPVLMICKSFVNLDQLFIKLVKAFEANGAYCRHHYNRALKDEEMGLGLLKPEENPEEKTLIGFAVKTMNKLKNLLD